MKNDCKIIDNKVIIVTGGSMGLGAAMVNNLRENGAKVVIADLVKCDHPDDVLFIKCNVANKKEVESMVSEVINKYGKIDGLVNNAGVSRPRLLVDFYQKEPGYELSEDDIDFMFSVNLKAVFFCSQAVARQMIKQKSGVIVNMSSEAGSQGSKGQSCYSATKAGVIGATLAWAKELGPFNIRVVSVEPGINIRTPMNDDKTFKALAYTRGQDPKNISTDYNKIIPLGRPGEHSEIADLITYLVSDKSSYITGTSINITGGKSKG